MSVEPFRAGSAAAAPSPPIETSGHQFAIIGPLPAVGVKLLEDADGLIIVPEPVKDRLSRVPGTCA